MLIFEPCCARLVWMNMYAELAEGTVVLAFHRGTMSSGAVLGSALVRHHGRPALLTLRSCRERT
jgi:hypothetical protein